jgi:Holliday junction resolvase RusA-like endonuclease
MIKIVIPGKPLPWRSPFVGKRGTFNPRHQIMHDYRILVTSQYRGEIIDSAVNCDVICYMPIPKATPRLVRELMLKGKIRPIRYPDRTNIAKLMEDCLNGIVLCDDSIIVGGRVEKWYCEHPRVELFIDKYEVSL